MSTINGLPTNYDQVIAQNEAGETGFFSDIKDVPNDWQITGYVETKSSKNFVDSRPHKAEDYRRAHTPIVRDSRKIGRNEPCPCGSGRKYKKCHIGK